MDPILKRILSLKGNQTSKSFAEEMGVSPSTFHYYERGRMPPIDFIMKVAEKRVVSAEWILHGRDKPVAKVREKVLDYAAASGIVANPNLQIISADELKETAAKNKDKLFSAVSLVEPTELHKDGVKAQYVKQFMVVSYSVC